MDDFTENFQAHVIEAIEDSEVVCVFFPRLGKTMMADFRQALGKPPMIVVDDRVNNPTERLDRLVAMRPNLPAPDEIQIVPWMASMSALSEAGVEGALIHRCARTGGPSLVAECRKCLARLMQVERAFIRSIVDGEGARTIWQRK